MSCQGHHVGQELFSWRRFSPLEIRLNKLDIDTLIEEAKENLRDAFAYEAEQCGLVLGEIRFHTPAAGKHEGIGASAFVTATCQAK